MSKKIKLNLLVISRFRKILNLISIEYKEIYFKYYAITNKLLVLFKQIKGYNYQSFSRFNINCQSKMEFQFSRKSVLYYVLILLLNLHSYEFKKKLHLRNQNNIRKIVKTNSLPLNKDKQQIIKTQIHKSLIPNHLINGFQEKEILIKESSKITIMVKQLSNTPSKWITKSEVANKIIKDRFADKKLEEVFNDKKNIIVFSDMNNFLHTISTKESRSIYYEEIKNKKELKASKDINANVIDLLETKKSQNHLNNALTDNPKTIFSAEDVKVIAKETKTTQIKLKKCREEKDCLREKHIGWSVWSALSLMRDRRLLNPSGIEWMGRNNNKWHQDLINTKAEEKNDRENERMRCVDGALRRTDKFGRILTAKEAFRELCYHFHGKGPSKNRQHKRINQYMTEILSRNKLTSSLAIKQAEKILEIQKKYKTPYILLEKKYLH